MKSQSYPSKFILKPFSLGTHMAHIIYKADIHIPGDLLEPLLLDDLNITTVTTMTIVLEHNVIVPGKT